MAEPEDEPTLTEDDRTADLLTKLSVLIHDPGAGLREPGRSGRTRPRFGAAVELLRKGAGLTQKELATLAGISESQLSLFLSAKEGREVSHDDVCRLAWALAGSLDGVVASENIGRRGQGRAKLDVILTTLSFLAGYAVQTRYEDTIWRRKVAHGEEKLRVGWFEWSPICEQAPGGKFSGLAKELTDAVVHLLGQKYEPVQLPFRRTRSAIRDRTVDLISPVIIKFPRRLAAMQFSENIEGLQIGFDAVIPARRFDDTLTPEGQKAYEQSERLKPKFLRPDRVLIIVPAGEVAASIAKLFFGSGFEFEEHDEKEHGYNTISAVLDHSTNNGRIPIIFTNEASCKRAAIDRPNEIILLNDVFAWPEFGEFRLPITFALHPDEPQLKAAVDEAIRALRDMRYLARLFTKYRDQDQFFAALFPEEVQND